MRYQVVLSVFRNNSKKPVTLCGLHVREFRVDSALPLEQADMVAGTHADHMALQAQIDERKSGTTDATSIVWRLARFDGKELVVIRQYPSAAASSAAQ